MHQQILILSTKLMLKESIITETMFCDTAINFWGLIYLHLKIWIQYSQKPDMAIDSGTAVYCPKLLSLLISRSLLSHRDKSRVARVGNAHRIKYYCVRDALRIILNTWLLELCSSTSNCRCQLIFDDFKMIFILWF